MVPRHSLSRPSGALLYIIFQFHSVRESETERRLKCWNKMPLQAQQKNEKQQPVEISPSLFGSTRFNITELAGAETTTAKTQNTKGRYYRAHVCGGHLWPRETMHQMELQMRDKMQRRVAEGEFCLSLSVLCVCRPRQMPFLSAFALFAARRSIISSPPFVVCWFWEWRKGCRTRVVCFAAGLHVCVRSLSPLSTRPRSGPTNWLSPDLNLQSIRTTNDRH
jgi:hypothetical protein